MPISCSLTVSLVDALLLGWVGVNPVGEALPRFSRARSMEPEAMIQPEISCVYVSMIHVAAVRRLALV